MLLIIAYLAVLIGVTLINHMNTFVTAHAVVHSDSMAFRRCQPFSAISLFLSRPPGIYP